MTKQDARSLSEESLELLRQQAHRLRRENFTWKEIADIVGVHLSTMMDWSRRFDIGAQTLSNVQSAKRGRRVGEKRTLSMVDESLLREHIVGGNPRQMALPFALWTRAAVQMAVQKRFGIEMPIRTVGEYLRRWGFTPQRPIKRAVEQRPALIKQWLEDSYPAIARRAKAEGAEIYWADETAIKQDTAWVRGYAPAGQTPVIEHAARWDGITMISALTNRGLVRFAFYDGAINTERFIEFLGGLIEDADRKVFLIVDNLKVHHANAVKGWVKERADKIELFYLPPYSPEANPDEMLNRDLKTALRTHHVLRTAEGLIDLAMAFMMKLQSMPGRVVSYFNSRSVRYASAGVHGCSV
jgi:transposase